MESKRLPAAFRDLEPFAAAWALPKESQRHAQRLASSMDELRAFYDAVVPRLEAILTYLNDFALDHLSREAENLLNLTLSLAEITPAVELFGQSEVPDAFDSRRFVPVED